MLYHQETKHHLSRNARALGRMDWARAYSDVDPYSFAAFAVNAPPAFCSVGTATYLGNARAADPGRHRGATRVPNASRTI